MKEVLLEIVWWTWCLPQTLLGFILNLIFKGEEKTITYRMKKYTYYNTTLKPGSISLGKYALLCDFHHDDIDTITHEHGHQIQSLILGPLYLLVISLPSLIWAGCFANYRAKHDVSYYKFYTEKWAENLSLVKPLSVIEAIILNVDDPWFYSYEIFDEEGTSVEYGTLHDIMESIYVVGEVNELFKSLVYDSTYLIYIKGTSEDYE